MKTRLALLVAILLCLPLTSMKCVSQGNSTKGEGRIFFDTPAGCLDIGVTWSSEGGSNAMLAIVNPSSQQLDGCLVFINSDGGVVSKVPAKIPPGATVRIPVPANAIGFYAANGSDCSTRAPGTSAEVTAMPVGTRYSQGGLFCFDLQGRPNVEHYIWAHSLHQGAFEESVDDLVKFGYQVDLAVQPGVTNVDAVLTEVVVLPGYDLQVTLANNSTLTDVDIFVNGTWIADQGSGGFPPPLLGAGWDACRFVLPSDLPEFNYDPASGESWENAIELHFRRHGNPDTTIVRRLIEFESD